MAIQKAKPASGISGYSAVNPGTIVLRSQLINELMDLPFAALMACVYDLLLAEGYTNVRMSGRVGYRGRNREGGFDLEAFLPSPLDASAQTGGGILRRKVIVQVKQFEPGTRVYQRNLDELRGACLRNGAIEGVLITTSDFSPIVRDAEANLRRHGGDAVAPVHLLNGEAVADRLVRHRIGVTQLQDGTIELDRSYFDGLRKGQSDDKHGEASASGSPSPTVSGQLPLGTRIEMSKDNLTLTLPLTLFTNS